MTRQIDIGYGAPQTAVLEQRIARLENQVATLAEALRTLAAALEGTPVDGAEVSSAARAARLAHELLIEARLGG